MDKLADCPCCGGKAEYIGRKMFVIQCQACRIRTQEYRSEHAAAQVWNIRNSIAKEAAEYTALQWRFDKLIQENNVLNERIEGLETDREKQKP